MFKNILWSPLIFLLLHNAAHSSETCFVEKVNDSKSVPIELKAGINELVLGDPGGQTHSMEIDWRVGDENTIPGLSLYSTDSLIRLPDWTWEPGAGNPDQRSTGWMRISGLEGSLVLEGCARPKEGVHGIHSCDVERDPMFTEARLTFWLFKGAGQSPLWAIDCKP